MRDGTNRRHEILLLSDDVGAMALFPSFGAITRLPLAETARALEMIERQDALLILVDARKQRDQALAVIETLAAYATEVHALLEIIVAKADRSLLDRGYQAGASGFILAAEAEPMLRFAWRAVRRLRSRVASDAVVAAETHHGQLPSWRWRRSSGRVELSAPLEEMLGPPPHGDHWQPVDLLALVEPRDRRMLLRGLARARRGSGTIEMRHRARSELGRRRTIRQTVQQIRNPDGSLDVGAMLTDVEAAAKRDRYLMHFDGLTGLANLAHLRAWLGRGTGAGLFMISISRFQRMNSLLGPALADQYLRAIAARLQRHMRAAARELDVAEADRQFARIGGAEFCLALGMPLGVKEAALVANRLLTAFDQPFRVGARDVFFTARIGIALPGGEDDDAEALLTRANAALAEADEAEPNSFRVYSDRFAASALKIEIIDRELRQALKTSDLRVVYQPQVNIASKRMVGVEALVRWQHPELGLLMPDLFIPVAERSGLISDVNDWVLENSLREAASWRNGGLEKLRLSINISADQFRRADIAELLLAAVKRSGFDPRRLTLELTETLVTEDLGRAASVMNQLKAAGLKLAIDDFGTGYSSLSYLKALPFDELKVDRLFIADLPGNKQDLGVLGAIVAMAKTLNMTVVAEGVEVEEQLGILAERGCDLYQGFLYSPPRPARELAGLI